MAVESTNLKAQRLSWGQAQEAADSFRDSLDAIATQPHALPRVAALAATALSSVREIQALQAPHIAEPDEATMNRIEKRMAAAEATARTQLKMLASLTPPVDSARLTACVAALDGFTKLNAEIVQLSRRNSNVHALALSLGQKRTLVATCEEAIRSLQANLAERGFPGTR
jgi:hypothetical protein